MTVTFTQEPPFTLKIERTLKASRATVWRCWTEPDLFRQWFCPKPWQVTSADLDVRPGGRMNSVMEGPDSAHFENTGMFLEVIPQQKLVFTDAYSESYIPAPQHFMTGFVELSDTASGGTQMIWGARHPDEEKMNQHLEMGFEDGWKAASQQLADLAEQL